MFVSSTGCLIRVLDSSYPPIWRTGAARLEPAKELVVLWATYGPHRAYTLVAGKLHQVRTCADRDA